MINPWTPMSDQNRMVLAMLIQYSEDNWCEYGKISIRGLLVDPIPNSLKQHHKKCMVESKEDYWLCESFHSLFNLDLEQVMYLRIYCLLILVFKLIN